MADPATLAIIALTTQAAGSAVGAAGSIFSGFAQSSMYKYQAGVAAVNQKIAKQNADYSREIGENKAEVSGMKTRQIVGKTKATQAASGFQAEGGSASDVRESEHMLGMSEQDTIRANAAKAAYGHDVEAMNFGAQSQLYRMDSKNDKIIG